jgi:ATP-dependent Lon protease
MDNGAKRALVPIENKRNFLDVSADIIEQVDPIFYGDPKTAAMKVMGGTLTLILYISERQRDQR